MNKPAYTILGPCPCQACGMLVYWARSYTRVNRIQTKGLAFWRESGGRMHHHTPVKRTRIKAANPYPMLANARAEWDNRQAGTSSTRVDSPTDAVALLVPGATASSRSEGRD